jgi:adenylate kinase
LKAKQLVILGAPGVGKGTQAKKLESQFGWAHISTGDMLRDTMRLGTPFGEKVKTYVETGDLVPDELIIEMVNDRFAQFNKDQGYIFDGFPRTVTQAEKLDGLLSTLDFSLDMVLSIDVSHEEIVQRLSKRFLCQNCGPVVLDGKFINNIPHCPICDGQLVRRKDDEPETVRHRLKVYEERTRSLIRYYEGRNLLKHIDGIGSVEEIYERLLKALTGMQGRE